MSRSMIGVRTSNVTSGAAALEIIAPSDRACYLVGLEIILAAATASVFGLGRPAAKGITPTTPATMLMNGDQSEARTTTALAWGTGPTVPTSFFRRCSMPATIGNDIWWDFVTPILIPALGSLVLWNLGTNGIVDVNLDIKE